MGTGVSIIASSRSAFPNDVLELSRALPLMYLRAKSASVSMRSGQRTALLTDLSVHRRLRIAVEALPAMIRPARHRAAELALATGGSMLSR